MTRRQYIKWFVKAITLEVLSVIGFIFSYIFCSRIKETQEIHILLGITLFLTAIYLFLASLHYAMYGIGTMAGLFEASEKLKQGRDEVIQQSLPEQVEQKEDEETES